MLNFPLFRKSLIEYAILAKSVNYFDPSPPLWYKTFIDPGIE